MKSHWEFIISVLGPLAALILVIGLFAVADYWLADGTFWSLRNARTVTVQTCVVAIAALGMTVIIIAGGIDLSAGTALALCATVLAWGLREDLACLMWHGDNFAGATDKLQETQRLLRSQNGDEAVLREVIERQKAKLLAILNGKIDQLKTDSGAAGEESGEAESFQERRLALLKEKKHKLTQPDARLPSTHIWLQGVPNSPYTAVLAVAAAVAAGMLAGLLNGMLISWLRVVPFIVTLGTMTVYLGMGKIISENVPIRPRLDQIPDWLANITKNTDEALLLGFPSGVWLALALAALLAVLLHWTVFGRYVFALGSNEATARLCGVHVPFYKIAVYTLGGLFIGAAGVCQFTRLSVGNPMSGLGLELRVIAAVVIGGGSLSGGRGAVLGTLTGAAIMAVIASGCTQLGLDNPIQDIILGAIIIAAVAVDQLRQRGREKG